MLKSLFLIILLVPICLSGWAMAEEQTQPLDVSSLDLVKNLSSKLAIKPEQAAGAAGAIFGLAKTKLSPEDFGKVSASVPGMDMLLKAAPVLDSGAGALAQLTSGTSGLASLAGSFQKLGLSPDMIAKCVPEILSFVNTKGGSAVSGLLGNVLK